MDENDLESAKAQEEQHEQAEKERLERIEEKKRLQTEIRQKIKERKRREEKEGALASREQELEDRAKELDERAAQLQKRADELEEKNRQLEEEARARELAEQEEEASKISLFDDDDEEEEEDLDPEAETETDTGINLTIDEDETTELEVDRPGPAEEGELSATVVGVSLDELIDSAKKEQASPELHENCNFCKVASGAMDVSIIYQDEIVTAFLHILPISLGHVLVVPNRHIRSIDELDDATSDIMFRVARMICSAIEESDITSDGMAIYLSDFLEADPSTRHVYLNVIPRNIGDGIGLKFKKQAKMGSEQLDQLRDIIKAKM